MINQSGPATIAVAVTPSDETGIGFTTRALFIGGDGDISVEMADAGTAVSFTGLTAGMILPIAVTRVNETGTDATGIVALR